MKNWLGWCVAGLVLLGSATVRADSKKWHEIGAYTVDGKDAIEVKIERPNVSQVRLMCTDGRVVINTLVVREGAQKTPHTIGRRIEAGDEQIVEVGEKVPATGFRISQDGRGTYKVLVR